MINRILLTAVGTFWSIALFAQTNNYVEVTVNDTVLVQADQFIYRLNFMPDMSTMLIDTAAAKSPNYYLKRAEEMREKQIQIKEEWQRKLNLAGFTVVNQNLNEAFMKNNYDNGMLVYINSSDSLVRLFSMVKNEKTVTGNLVSVKTGNEEIYFNKLYKKLLEKARKRGISIAESIGKKIIDISSITENRYFNSGWNTYNQNYIPPPPPSFRDNKAIMTNYQIQSNLTVRFLVK